MDLKTLLGDDYKDGMTIEEINAALADKNFVDSSTLPKSVSKEVFDKTASELAAVKKKLRELQESSMTAEENNTSLPNKTLLNIFTSFYNRYFITFTIIFFNHTTLAYTLTSKSPHLIAHVKQGQTIFHPVFIRDIVIEKTSCMNRG
jgi:uncharacterized coiled-coil protein SlyX